jgi:succinate dehydrogenase/fumarate reductase flavoprotein subunit
MSAPLKDVDLLVLGSGAGGMTAALTAATLGLHVLLVEKTEWIGGTTARSAGSQCQIHITARMATTVSIEPSPISAQP